MAKRKTENEVVPTDPYSALLGVISDLLEESRRSAARAVNHVLTATYWELGR